jgi:phosphatidylserine decarboxylase
MNGTYFSELTITTFSNPVGSDDAAPSKAQSYISHVATRAIFMIEVDPPIRWIGIVFVGMADVSTCNIAYKFKQVNLPQKVAKEKEVGIFHHGGSSHCLLLPEGLDLKWFAKPRTATQYVTVRSYLAQIREYPC